MSNNQAKKGGKKQRKKAVAARNEAAAPDPLNPLSNFPSPHPLRNWSLKSCTRLTRTFVLKHYRRFRGDPDEETTKTLRQVSMIKYRLTNEKAKFYKTLRILLRQKRILAHPKNAVAYLDRQEALGSKTKTLAPFLENLN